MLDSDGEGLSCPIDSKRRQVQKSEAVADESNLQLLLDLHHRRGLPAIMFNYDRSECEKIMRFVIAKLEEYELRWKNTSKEWLKTMSEYETWKRSQEKSTKAPAAVKMSTLDEDVSKLDIIREQTTKDASKWEYFDPDQPLPRFSFADSRACPSEDLEGLLKRLRWSNLHPTFINGLKRGVGVHHAGMNRQYRQVQNLLSEFGAPLNFAGLVSHLYFTENSVFAFHSLLKGGYLHNLCANVHERPNEVVLELLLVLSHLFCRQPCPRFRDNEWLETIKKSSSKVILPPLPHEALETLREHNRETLSIFKRYVQTYVRQHLANTPDDRLPFSGYRVGNGNQTPASLSTPTPEIRSPFAALSGFDDSFESVRDLCTMLREGVFLEESAVPYICVYPDDTDGRPWNAYLYDFFKHGDLKTLVRSNGIKAGDVWLRLKDFSLILATIVTSPDSFLNPKSGYPDMTEVQDAFDKMEDDQDEGEEYNIPGIKVQLPKENAASKKTARKAVLADSWDQVEESSEADYSSESEADGESDSAPSEEEDRANLMNILKTFKILQQGFDTKFRKVWA
ncbi:hypothetical protein ACKVWC_003418 [Pyricularia oryzae]